MTMGTSCYLAVVGTATLCIALEMNSWNSIFLTITSLSWVLIIPSIAIYDISQFPTPNLTGATQHIFGLPWIFI